MPMPPPSIGKVLDVRGANFIEPNHSSLNA